MKSYTTSEARQNLAAILDEARRNGAGQSFVLRPEAATASPLDVEGVTPVQPITREDIVAALEESRRRYEY